MTSADRFDRLQRLFHELDEMPAELRRARMDALARTDPELHADLLALFEDSLGQTLRERKLEGLAGAARDLIGELPTVKDPEVIGPYELLHLLGAGGMGRVYLAQQQHPVTRRVALKLTRHGLDSQQTMARFRAERQALAVLDHPGIAKVFDAGTLDDGRPWFAMEYIDGVPITLWASQRDLDLRQRIKLLIPVCEAVQHAHRKGMIHRDLKPSNILVIDDAGVGQAKVIDFGIAKTLDLPLEQRSFATAMGELVGTPEYMSPEQASLGEIDVDTRSDVYALGLVLYELLVGTLPMDAATLRKLGFIAMCQQIRETDTPRPSIAARANRSPITLRWRDKLRGDLDSVVLKALAKDREQRYDSAAALADDLHRYLDDQPVLAQPPSLRYRGGKFLRRHRLPVAAGAAVLVALLVGTGSASFGMLKAREAQAHAEWSQQQTALRRGIADSYADVLLRVFGASQSIEDAGQRLLDYQQSLDWDSAPDSAALASYAIGRHFLSRNDYPSARQVFEPWLRREVGAPELTRLGWGSIGYAYRYTGAADQALQAFRTAAKLYDVPARRTPEYAAVMTQIALLSGELKAIEMAEFALAEVLRTNLPPHIRMTMLNSRFQLAARFSSQHVTYQVIRDVVAEIDRHSNMHLDGSDTNRLNLASMEIFLRGDLEAASVQLDRVYSSDEMTKGISRNSAWRIELEGVIAWFRGDLIQAESLLGNAMEQQERFAGRLSEVYRRTGAALVKVLVDQMRLDDAELQLAQLQADGDDDWDNRWLALAEADLALSRSGADAATEVLKRCAFSPQMDDRSQQMRFYIDRLLDSGVSFPQ